MLQSPEIAYDHGSETNLPQNSLRPPFSMHPHWRVHRHELLLQTSVTTSYRTRNHSWHYRGESWMASMTQYRINDFDNNFLQGSQTLKLCIVIFFCKDRLSAAFPSNHRKRHSLI